MARRRTGDESSAGSGKARRDFGDGSVYQRHDERWVAQIVTSQHPRRVRRIVTPRATNTRQAALKLLDRLKRELASGRDVATGRQTLTDWMDTFLVSVVGLAEKTPATQADYRYLSEYLILPDLGTARIETLSETQLERWRDAHRTHYAASVVKRACNLLRRALREAHERGAIPRNPARVLANFEARTTQPAHLTPAQADAVTRAALRYRVGLAVVCALRLGLRVGEALGLRWSDYDRTTRTLRIQRQVLRDRSTATPKYGGVRVLPVPPALAAMLDARYPADAPFGYLCTADNSELPIRYDNARRALATVLKTAKLEEITSWHGLRHTLGARLTELGATEAIMAAVFGHAGGTVTTARYSHADAEALRSWIDRAEQAKDTTQKTG